MLVVARHARRDADRDSPGGVVHEDRQPERRLEEPDRGRRLEGADQQRVELVEEQVRALDHREHARVGGDLPRSALRRPDRKRTAAEQLRDHDGADHDRGAVADGARKRRSGRAGAGRDQRDRRDQEHDALRDRHRDDRSDPRLRDQDGAVELHHRAGDECDRDPAQRPGQARLRVEVGDRPGREDEDHADEPRDQHLQPQRVGDVVRDRAPVAAPLGDEASDRRTDPEVHHEREQRPDGKRKRVDAVAVRVERPDQVEREDGRDRSRDHAVHGRVERVPRNAVARDPLLGVRWGQGRVPRRHRGHRLRTPSHRNGQPCW